MVCNYSENTNKITIDHPGTNFSVGMGTTCSELLGARIVDVSADGVYRAPDGVNLAKTSSFYIKSNMRTLNRDPVGLGYSNIIAKNTDHPELQRSGKIPTTWFLLCLPGPERELHYYFCVG